MDAIAHTFYAPDVRYAWLIHATVAKAQEQNRRCQSFPALHHNPPAGFYPFHMKPIFPKVLSFLSMLLLPGAQCLRVLVTATYASPKKLFVQLLWFVHKIVHHCKQRQQFFSRQQERRR